MNLYFLLIIQCFLPVLRFTCNVQSLLMFSLYSISIIWLANILVFRTFDKSPVSNNKFKCLCDTTFVHLFLLAEFQMVKIDEYYMYIFFTCFSKWLRFRVSAKHVQVIQPGQHPSCCNIWRISNLHNFADSRQLHPEGDAEGPWGRMEDGRLLPILPEPWIQGLIRRRRRTM